MNHPTKRRTKAIVYSGCWQSVSVRLCVGNGCILRRVSEWPHERGHVRNSVGAATSERKILLPMGAEYMERDKTG